jgi:hypothetical protein
MNLHENVRLAIARRLGPVRIIVDQRFSKATLSWLKRPRHRTGGRAGSRCRTIVLRPRSTILTVVCLNTNPCHAGHEQGPREMAIVVLSLACAGLDAPSARS